MNENWYKVITGDCISGMQEIADGTVNTCVTSPPYYGLRDYNHEAQIGTEDTPEEYVQRLVEVFREVRRVLRDDGTVWLNLGDSYAAQRSGTHQPAETLAGGRGGKTEDGERVNRSRIDGYNPTRNASAIGLKHKDLIGIPWRVAFALQADGWYLRQDIIWSKPNPMPESVRDRCTKAHEYVFLLSKSAKYYYGAEGAKEPAVGGSKSDKPMMRNRRSVWSVPVRPYKGAHFATFPPALIEPCVLSGCPEGGIVLDPFGGSGTTAGVALKHRRNAIVCELNPDYVTLIDDRVKEIRKG